MFEPRIGKDHQGCFVLNCRHVYLAEAQTGGHIGMCPSVFFILPRMCLSAQTHPSECSRRSNTVQSQTCSTHLDKLRCSHCTTLCCFSVLWLLGVALSNCFLNHSGTFFFYLCLCVCTFCKVALCSAMLSPRRHS